MKILFTICARAGSKGIKNKNIRNFLGYPLAFYTLSAIDLYVRNNKEDSIDIVLNTDSEKLISMFENNNIQNTDIIFRNKNLALDNTPKVLVIYDSLLNMEERKNYKYDMIIDLDITSPLRTVNDIKNLILKKKKSECDVVFSVTDSRRNPYFNMVRKTEKGYVRVIDSNFNTRQEAPEIYDMNASMYAYSPKFLKSQKGIFEGKCEIIKMMDTAVLDLDHENDFELMEVIAEYLFKVNSEYKEIQDNIKGKRDI